MIQKIRMQKVASFDAATSLETDKRVNLIYGLNGTGKSTISDFLYNPDDPRFQGCETLPEKAGKVFVYNQSFVRDYFFETGGLKGVFTLSPENRAAEQEIERAKAAIERIQESINAKQDERTQVLAEWERQEQGAFDETWRIKRNNAGDGRPLDYCLDRLKGDRQRLFSHLIPISQPETEPERSVSDIRRDAEALQGEEVAFEAELPELTFGAHDVEEATIFSRAIIGSQESEAATLIQSLGNADWVREGLRYISDQVDDHAGQCPFCQERTVTKELVARLEAHFDDAYQTISIPWSP